MVLLAGSVLHLVHVVTTHSAGLAERVQAAIADLTAALDLAEEDPVAAAAHATAAGGCCTSALDLRSCSTTELELTTVAQTCVVDLQEVIDLRM
ncbi:MAG: hypothetical protein ACLPXZ_24920 [Mycobacterium sp.]